MTLVVVLLIGLGAVLIVSAIETDPTTGRSISVVETVRQLWTDQIDFSQPAGPTSTKTNATGATRLSGSALISYQDAATLAYIRRQQQRGF